MEMDNVTFEHILEQYFFNKSLRPVTEVSYRKVVIALEKYTDKQPGEIDTRTVLEWRRYTLKEQCLEPVTWNNRVAHLRAIFNFSMQTGLLAQIVNPFNGTIVRTGNKKKKIITQAQMDTLFRFMERHCEYERQDPRIAHYHRNTCYPAWFWLTALAVFRYTGMRQNQLIHLRLCDINLDERWINLRVAGSKNHNEHRVPIVSALYPHMERLINRSLAVDAEPEAQLFNIGRFDSCRRDKYLTGMNVYPLRAFFRRLSRECKFTISSHRFRHTIATHMMKSPDRNLQAVKKLLGHVSIQSTLAYIDESVDNLRDILENELM